jgi:hypothetical protein
MTPPLIQPSATFSRMRGEGLTIGIWAPSPPFLREQGWGEGEPQHVICERSEAIQGERSILVKFAPWIASSLALLAITLPSSGVLARFS